MTRNDSGEKQTAEIISIVARLEKAALDRDYEAVSDLDIALRQQAAALANGRFSEAAHGQAVGALWSALDAVQRASSAVEAQRVELIRRRGQEKLVHLRYGQADTP